MAEIAKTYKLVFEVKCEYMNQTVHKAPRRRVKVIPV